MGFGTETGTARRNQAAQDTTQQERVARIKGEIEADWLSKVGYTSAPQKAVRTIDVDSWYQAPKIIAELAKNGRENIRLQFPDRSSNPAVRTDQQAIRQFFIDNHNASLDEMFKKLAEKMVSSSTLNITQETAQGLINAYQPSRLTSKSLSVTKMCELGNKTENEFTQPILAAAEDTKDSTKPKTVFTITGVGLDNSEKLQELAQSLQEVVKINTSLSEGILNSKVWWIPEVGRVLKDAKSRSHCKEISIKEFIEEFQNGGDSSSSVDESVQPGGESQAEDTTELDSTTSLNKPLDTPTDTANAAEPNSANFSDAGSDRSEAKDTRQQEISSKSVTGDDAHTHSPEPLIIQAPESNNDGGQATERPEQDNSESSTSADIKTEVTDSAKPNESAELPQTQDKATGAQDSIDQNVGEGEPKTTSTESDEAVQKDQMGEIVEGTLADGGYWSRHWETLARDLERMNEQYPTTHRRSKSKSSRRATEAEQSSIPEENSEESAQNKIKTSTKTRRSLRERLSSAGQRIIGLFEGSIKPSNS